MSGQEAFKKLVAGASGYIASIQKLQADVARDG